MYFEVVCSATDGNPNMHQITLTKNTTVMKIVDKGNSLVYRTKDTYGLFTCVVKSLLSKTTKELLLQEQGNETIII